MATQGYKSVKKLKEAMYEEMRYTRACYKLLNATGETGCEAQGGAKITAPLIHYKDIDQFMNGQHIVLVSVDEAETLLLRFLANATLREHIVGVLVTPYGRPAHQSVAPLFPSAANMPYTASGYVWNPYGTGLSRQYLGIPVYLMTEALANDTVWRADYNKEFGLKGARHVAEMDLPMTAVGDSKQCILDNQCLPVGAYGVWSALPAIPDVRYNTTAPRPITLVVASVDSTSLFHDLTQAAGASLSGLVSMLTAITMLARAGIADRYDRQLVFVALAGEAWDMMGSKRMLYEMHYNSTFVAGLHMDLVDQVLEVGQVGLSWSETGNATTLYMHSQQGPQYGNASILAEALAAGAARITDTLVSVLPASASNPGIPPSALSSFVRIKPGVAGAVLADFDAQFRNQYYQSEYDDAYSDITMEAIVDTATLLIHTLHGLASGPDVPPLAVNRTDVAIRVSELVLCLMLPEPGMRCPLASQLMSPDVEVFYDGTQSVAVKGYTGVLRFVDYDPKTSRNKPNLARFLFNLMGNMTASVNGSSAGNSVASWEGQPCDTTVNICPWPLACIGWRYSTKDPKGMGRCLNTTTNYVPAYSCGLTYGPVQGYTYWKWYVDNFSDAWHANYSWPPDPMWTESNWPTQTPTLKVYQQESTSTLVAILVSGICVSIGVAIVSWLGVEAFERRLKQA